MQKAELQRLIIKTAVKRCVDETGKKYVPVAASNRHVHLSRKDVEILFGAGYELKQMRPLSQPGQFACEEKLILVGPKGTISGIRVLGPERSETQVEISVTDSFKLGIKPVIRMSGDLAGSPGGKLVGPKGAVELQQGVIVAARHLHLSEEQAGWYGLKDGDSVKLKKEGERSVTLHNVIVRCGKGHDLEVHIDTDEANAALIKNGDLLEIVTCGCNH